MSEEELKIASLAVKPTFGQAFFTVRRGYVGHYLVFDYEDPLHYYEHLSREGRLDEEVEKLTLNMQSFLDEEVTLVNGRVVRPKVDFVNLGFRGTASRPYVVFHISFRAPIKKGLNTYENFYKPEEVEYDYVVYWSFPKGSRVVEVEVDSEWEVEDETLIIYGRRGRKSLGRERFVFEI